MGKNPNFLDMKFNVVAVSIAIDNELIITHTSAGVLKES